MTRSIEKVLHDFRQPVPYDLCTNSPRLIKKKWQGKFCTFLIGTSWDALVELADQYAPGWQYKIITSPTRLDGVVYTVASIEVPALVDDQLIWITRQATGAVEVLTEDKPAKDDKPKRFAGQLLEGFGNPAANSTTGALKKAFKLFGLGTSFAAPDIFMKVILKGGGIDFPKYDPGKACSPWLPEGKQDQVPKYVKDAMSGTSFDAKPGVELPDDDPGDHDTAPEETTETIEPGNMRGLLIACGLVNPEHVSLVWDSLSGEESHAAWLLAILDKESAKVYGVLDELVHGAMADGTPATRLAFLNDALHENNKWSLKTRKEVREAVAKWREF